MNLRRCDNARPTAQVAAIALLGTYTAASFVAPADGRGAAAIAVAAQTAEQSLQLLTRGADKRRTQRVTRKFRRFARRSAAHALAGPIWLSGAA